MDQTRQLLALVAADATLMELLTIIEGLQLREGCLCAGAIRNTVWNALSGQEAQLLSDVDVIFYDPTVSYDATLAIEKALQTTYPTYQWEVKNQVDMHVHHPGAAPYDSVLTSLAHFPETCTALGVRKTQGDLELLAPYGVADLFAFEVKPTPLFRENEVKLVLYRQRLQEKNWQDHWPGLTINLA